MTDEHNLKFARGAVTFSRGLSRTPGLRSQAVRRIAKTFKVPPRAIRGRTVTVLEPGKLPPAPPSVDWRARGLVTPVKDQGFFCDCCWAFSATAALEAQFLIQQGKQYDISEQQLIDCTRNEETGNWGCDGGSQAMAYEYIQNSGIESSETYPYEERLPHDGVSPCRYNASRSIGNVDGYYRIRPRNETFLKEVVAAIGPVAIGFHGTSEAFESYEHGIYDDPQCPR